MGAVTKILLWVLRAALLVLVLGATNAWAQRISNTAPPHNASRDQVGNATRDLTTESRVALVFGNSAYKHVHPLTNPVNDANAMAETLRSLGFEVLLVDDGDRTTMVKALGQFRKMMRADGVALFYYAGHGMQVRGRN